MNRISAIAARIAEEQVAMPQSNAGKGIVMKLLEDAKKALEAGDKASFDQLIDKISKTPLG